MRSEPQDLGCFSIASGTVIGARHAQALRPNQDRLAVCRTPERIVGVIADGCSSAAQSEVGAALAARMLARLVVEEPRFDTTEDRAALWHEVTSVLTEQLRTVAGWSGDLPELYLFTLVCLVITPTLTEVVGLGDGCAALNDDFQIVAAKDNTPPYLGYRLWPANATEFALDDLVLRRWQALPTAALLHAVIGSDGLVDLPPAARATLCSDPRTFGNPDFVRRQLARMNRLPPGVLPDDTTVILVGRP